MSRRPSVRGAPTAGADGRPRPVGWYRRAGRAWIESAGRGRGRGHGRGRGRGPGRIRMRLQKQDGTEPTKPGTQCVSHAFVNHPCHSLARTPRSGARCAFAVAAAPTCMRLVSLPDVKASIDNASSGLLPSVAASEYPLILIGVFGSRHGWPPHPDVDGHAVCLAGRAPKLTTFAPSLASAAQTHVSRDEAGVARLGSRAGDGSARGTDEEVNLFSR